MAKTLKDILKLVSSRINSNELSAALSASDPLGVEFDEGQFQAIEGQFKGLTTFDEAVNNPDVLNALKPKITKTLEIEHKNKYKAETLHGVETELTKFGRKIGLDLGDQKWSDQLKAIETHKDQLTGNVDEKVKSMTLENERLNKQILKERKGREADYEKFESEKNNILSDNFLRNEIVKSLPLAKAYQEPLVRDGIIDRLVGKVKEKAVINFDNKSQSIKFMNPEQSDLELFVDNKKAGVIDLIGEDAQPYIAATPDGGDKTNHQTTNEAVSNESSDYDNSAAGIFKRQRDLENQRLMGEVN